MTITTPSITLAWVAVGEAAYGLVLGGRVVALVYWERANVAELDGDPVVTDAGVLWVPTELPWEHYYLFAAPSVSDEDWVRAREQAARAYFGWTAP